MTPIQQAIHDVRNRLQLAISNLEMGKPVSAVEALREASSLLERLRALEDAPFARAGFDLSEFRSEVSGMSSQVSGSAQNPKGRFHGLRY